MSDSNNNDSDSEEVDDCLNFLENIENTDKANFYKKNKALNQYC